GHHGRARSQRQHGRAPLKILQDARVAAGAFGKHGQNMAVGQHFQRVPDRAAIRFAPPHRKRVQPAQKPPQRAELEQLGLGHEVERALENDAHDQRIQVVDVVADQDGGTVLGQMVNAFHGDAEPAKQTKAHDAPRYSVEHESSSFRTSSRTWSTTSSTVLSVVSISTASSALRSGATSRVESRRSRLSMLARMSSSDGACPAARSSSHRRRARSSADAVRNTFTSASGKTTVPMSRPSMTTPPPAA